MVHAGLDYTDPPVDDGLQDPDGGGPVRLLATGAGRERLDRFLVSALAASRQEQIPEGLSRSRIQRWIAMGAVRVNGALVPAAQRLRGLEEIEVWPQPLESEQAFRPEPVDFDVVHVDADVAVVNKPAGLVTHPAPGHWQGTLMNGLLHRFAQSRELPRAGIVHRLDRDTSGLLACALSERGFAALTRQLADRSMKRRYLAVMPMPPRASGSIEAAIGRDPRDRLRMAVLPASHPGAKPARTDWQVLSEAGGLALVLCRLHSGRTHQIRVHFASLGCALLGDPLYGRPAAIAAGPDADPASTLRFTRQALHAWRLSFEHPDGRGSMAFEAPLPADMAALVDALGLTLPAVISSEPPQATATEPGASKKASARKGRR